MAADEEQLPDRAGPFTYVSCNGALAIVAALRPTCLLRKKNDRVE
jgi:hypothetical protein